THHRQQRQDDDRNHRAAAADLHTPTLVGLEPGLPSPAAGREILQGQKRAGAHRHPLSNCLDLAQAAARLPVTNRTRKSRITAPTNAAMKLMISPPPVTPSNVDNSHPPRNAPMTPTTTSMRTPYPWPLTTRPAKAPAIPPMIRNTMSCMRSSSCL